MSGYVLFFHSWGERLLVFPYQFFGMLFQVVKFEFTLVEMLAQYLYVGLSAFLVFFGIEQLSRYLKADKKVRQDAAHMTFLMIAFMLIGYAIYIYPTIVNYFYEVEYAWRWPLQQIPVTVIVLPFGFIAENILLKQKLKRRIFTSIGIMNFVYMVLVTIWTAVDPTIIGANVVPLFLPTLIIYGILGLVGFVSLVQILFVRLNPQKAIRKKILMTLLSVISAFIFSEIGSVFRTGPGTNENYLYVVMRGMTLFFWILAGYILMSIPSYSEIEWQSGLLELHIIHTDTGISLFSYDFSRFRKDLTGKKEERPSTDLITGGITGMKSLLGEIAGDKGKLKNIEIGTRKLLFNSGKHITCLLLCENNLGVYHSILLSLVEAVEKRNKRLENFTGILDDLVFEPIVQELFEVKKP